MKERVFEVLNRIFGKKGTKSASQVEILDVTERDLVNKVVFWEMLHYLSHGVGSCVPVGRETSSCAFSIRQTTFNPTGRWKLKYTKDGRCTMYVEHLYELDEYKKWIPEESIEFTQEYEEYEEVFECGE